MKNFGRALRLALHYRWTFAGSVACALMIAVLWGGNIGTVYPIVPSPEGVETLMMLVRYTPLPADEDLPLLLGELDDQMGTDREYVRWFENGRLVTSEPDRSPGGRADASDPAERTQARIRQRLGDRFAFSRAVSFFNVGHR